MTMAHINGALLVLAASLPAGAASTRRLSLPKSVADAGSIDDWHGRHPELSELRDLLDGMCTATTVAEAQAAVRAILSLGHPIWGYAYLRMLHHKQPHLYFGALLASPEELLPVVYTPTVGEACQKFGRMPFYPRGCYVSLSQRGHVRAVLEEYAVAHLPRGADGRFECQCVVFTDGGRILGLGDLGAWGMGIPVGKLDLYAVCAGFDPARTVPLLLDVGCSGPEGNSAGLDIRNDPCYTGLRQERERHTSAAGTLVNSAYYASDADGQSIVSELLDAARDLFGPACVLQFEDFNSNDAFPLLEAERRRHLTYNDDIQGTAAVCVAAILGALRLRMPDTESLVDELRDTVVLFHGAGSANLGTASLMMCEAGVPAGNIYMTNSRGLLWRDREDGDGEHPPEGNFRNDEQKRMARLGKPTWESTDLVETIRRLKPDVLVGAVGGSPGCFSRAVVEAMMAVQEERAAAARLCGWREQRIQQQFRPTIFALSNPKTQAEITAQDCYHFSRGRAIFGSGTRFAPLNVDSRMRRPGQVNNFFIFPGLSFGLMACAATIVPESLFLVAAEAVAKSLDKRDLAVDSVVPDANRIREVSENVAVAVVLAAQEQGVATIRVGERAEEVRRVLRRRMWAPPAEGNEEDGAPRVHSRARSRVPGHTATEAVEDRVRGAGAAIQHVADATTAARVKERTRALADAAIKLVEKGVKEAGVAVRMVEDSVKESAQSAPGLLRHVSDVFTRGRGAIATLRRTGTVGGEVAAGDASEDKDKQDEGEPELLPESGASALGAPRE